MKLRKILSIFFIFVLLITMILPVWATGDEEENETEEEAPSYSHSIFSTPVGAAMLIELNSGEVLYELNVDEERYPASLTKIMTCMLVLENCQLNEIVTVSQTALDGMEVGSSLGADHLQPGEQMVLKDMLYYMMLASANESCIALAEHVAGSKEAFVDMMNQRALELGCTNTHFANPHGLHDEEHYTTASDLSKITLEAMKNETFLEITNTPSYDLPATNMRQPQTVSSTNKLINKNLPNNNYYYSKASGIKTGFTTPAGRCLISTATNDNLNLLAVIMGAQTVEDENGNWWERSFPECINLFEWGFTEYKISTVMSTLYPVAEIPVNMAAGASTVALAPAKEVRTLIEADYDPDEIILDIDLHVTSLDAPVEAGQVVGNVTVSYQGEVLGSSELSTITAVARSEVTHHTGEAKQYVRNNWWKWLVGLLIAAVVVIIGGCILLQYYRRQQRRRKVAARRRALELQRRKQEWHIDQ